MNCVESLIQQPFFSKMLNNVLEKEKAIICAIMKE